jgi:hypothetical protein
MAQIVDFAVRGLNKLWYVRVANVWYGMNFDKLEQTSPHIQVLLDREFPSIKDTL